MKIAFISDVHSAAEPYAAALAAARDEGFDRLVLMGDLLTYGPEPERCLELTAEAIDRDNAVLFAGNHDALYRSGEGYERPLRDWIQESVEWTRARIPAGAMDALPWRERWSEGRLLASHANPFGAGDWTYLRSEDDYQAAAAALEAQGFAHGVFGHVHRWAQRPGPPASVATLGSVGQPRDDRDRRPMWAVGELTDDTFALSPRPLEYDWREHCRALRNTGMSESTVEQLARFFA